MCEIKSCYRSLRDFVQPASELSQPRIQEAGCVSLLVTFLIDSTKYLLKQLKEGRLYFGPQSEGTLHYFRKTRWQKLESADHIASVDRRIERKRR